MKTLLSTFLIFMVLMPYHTASAKPVSDTCYVTIRSAKAKMKMEFRSMDYNSIYGSRKGRNFSNFKTLKPDIDSYTVFSPIVQLCYFKSDTLIRDTLDSELIKKYWEERYKRILSYYKYHLIRIDKFNPPDACCVGRLLTDLSLLSKSVKEYDLPDFLLPLCHSLKTRYALFTFIGGQYYKTQPLLGTPKKTGHFNATLLVVDSQLGKIMFVDGQVDEFNAEKPETTDEVLRSLLKNLKYS